MKVHHIGIIVDDIEKNIMLYEKLGYLRISETKFDDNQNVLISFLRSYDGTQVLELIQSIDATSSIHNFKSGFHHICFEVSEEYLHVFKTLKIGKIFTKPINAPAINNREVLFACLNNGTFIEFLL